MAKQHEITSYISKVNAKIEAFRKKTPQSVNSNERLAIEMKLADIEIAVKDLMEDEESPEVQDMLKAYLDQVEELSQGQA